MSVTTPIKMSFAGLAACALMVLAPVTAQPVHTTAAAPITPAAVIAAQGSSAASAAPGGFITRMFDKPVPGGTAAVAVGQGGAAP